MCRVVFRGYWGIRQSAVAVTGADSSPATRNLWGTATLRTALCGLLLLPGITPALAAELQTTPSPHPILAAADQEYLFNIPSKPLPQAIADFSATTGIQVLYTERSTFDHTAPALQGSFSPSEALQRLLNGTPLRYRFTTDNAVTIELIAENDAAVTTLGTMTVYGAKNTNTLNDTSASVGIVTAAEIEDQQLRSFRDAFRNLGNVMDADWTDAGFVIRGINSEGLTPGGAPLASIYIDGALQTINGSRRGARGLWDVEQVEVYRGPQSTLSGRAALAGAVYIKTVDPSFEPEARVRLSAGTQKTRGGAFTVGGPVVEDQLAMRLSGEYAISESQLNYPDYEDFDRYQDFIEDKYYQVRGKALYLPESMPSTSMLLSYSLSHDAPNISDIAGPVLGYSYDDERGDFNLPVFSEARAADTQNVSLELQNEFSPELMFTSLTSYSYTDLDRSSVNEGSSGETNFISGDSRQSTATQEFRFNYQHGPWVNVAGVYLAKEITQAQYRRPDYFGNSDISRNTEENLNAAIFGEAGYEIVPNWQLILGGRLDFLHQNSSNFFSRNGTATVDQNTDFNEEVLLPKLGINRELNANETLGFTVQKGFRNGGASVQTSTGDLSNFDPEYIWNYEFSYKGRFMENRLLVTANLFYADWKGQQVEILEDPSDFTSSYTTNAGRSSLKGFELETRYQASEALSTFASIGYVDTAFEEFEDITLGDLSGYPFPEAPEWNLALGSFYQHNSGFFVGGDLKYLSRYLARFGSDPQEYLDSYWIANTELGYRATDWDLTLFVENLFDKDYFVFHDANTSGDIAGTLGPRRLIGVSVTASF